MSSEKVPNKRKKFRALERQKMEEYEYLIERIGHHRGAEQALILRPQSSFSSIPLSRVTLALGTLRQSYYMQHEEVINMHTHKKCHHDRHPWKESKQYINSAISILHHAIKTNTLPCMNDGGPWDFIRKTGICRTCTYYLAIQFPAILIQISHKAKEQPHRRIGYLVVYIMFMLERLLIFPELARYYLQTLKLWKYVINIFRIHCAMVSSLLSQIEDNNIKNNSEAIFGRVATFGNRILGNSHLLRGSKYWRKHIKFMMKYLIQLFQYEIKHHFDWENTKCTQVYLDIHFMIMLFFYHKDDIPEKSVIKYEKYISQFKSNLKCTKLSDVRGRYCITGVQELCHQLQDVIKYPKFEGELLNDIRGRVWKDKKGNMKCLWKECKNRAKDMESERLRKCDGCRVARYCSKSCQKKDWVLGDHKYICHKFATLSGEDLGSKVNCNYLNVF